VLQQGSSDFQGELGQGVHRSVHLSAFHYLRISADSFELCAYCMFPQHTGPTLRMAFHDCGTWQRYPKPAFDKNPQCGGCNGSFKKEYEDGKTTGFCTFPQQNGECIS
jgi:hypothetical protein